MTMAMARISSFALASVLTGAASSAAGAVHSELSGRRGGRRALKLGARALRRGDPATEALLRAARPHRRSGHAVAAAPTPRRRLDEEFEMDGSYDLKFSRCVEVRTYDEDLFDEDLVAYVEAGQVASVASYVLFHVCQGDNCYYDAEDDLYIVDLATYLTNVATYHANKRNDYCEQCEEFDEYCNPEEEDEDEDEEDDEDEDGDGDEEDEDEDGDGDDEDEEEEGDDEDEDEDEEEDEGDEDEEDEEADEDQEEDEGEDEDEERKLKKQDRRQKKRRKLTKKDRKSITRRLADKQYIDCDQCNDYECFVDYDEMDDGVQRRDELDEEVSEWIEDLADCKESGVQWNDLDLFLGAMCSPYGDGVELAVFVNEDCTMYTNQQSFYDVFDPDNDNDNGMNYLTYAEEFIKNAFSEVTTCLQQEFDDPDEDDDGNANDDEEQEYEVNDYCAGVMEEDVADFNNCAVDEDQEEEDQDDAYAWYEYDMKEADDIDEVCVALNEMAGEYSYAYDEEGSGTWYERNKNGEITDGSEAGIELTPGIIAIIVIVGLIVVAGAVFLLKPKRKPSDSNEPVYQGGTMM